MRILEQINNHPAMRAPIVRERVLQGDAWARLHRDAVVANVHGHQNREELGRRCREEFAFEQSILSMMVSIDAYAGALDGPDYVLGEALAEMVTGWRALLNGPIGRLDGGALDAWACGLLFGLTGEEQYQ